MADAKMLKKVPVREQDPKVRATNVEEVGYGYNQEEAMEEASRCINCKNAKCIQGCPVGINIPAFVHEVKEKKETTVPPKSISVSSSITWKSLNFLTVSFPLTNNLANSIVNSEPNTGTFVSTNK